jgi:hypothetical protein
LPIAPFTKFGDEVLGLIDVLSHWVGPSQQFFAAMQQ